MTVRMAASLADPSAGAALDKAVADDDHAAGKKANAPDEENAEAAAEHQVSCCPTQHSRLPK